MEIFNRYDENAGGKAARRKTDEMHEVLHKLVRLRRWPSNTPPAPDSKRGFEAGVVNSKRGLDENE